MSRRWPSCIISERRTDTGPRPGRPEHIVGRFGDQKTLGWEQVASGLAAVWDEADTREAIFDAMEPRRSAHSRILSAVIPIVSRSSRVGSQPTSRP
jgi:hypothetical protein